MPEQLKDRIYSLALIAQPMLASVTFVLIARRFTGELVFQTLLYLGAVLMILAGVLVPLLWRERRRPFPHQSSAKLLFFPGVPFVICIWLLSKL